MLNYLFYPNWNHYVIIIFIKFFNITWYNYFDDVNGKQSIYFMFYIVSSFDVVSNYTILYIIYGKYALFKNLWFFIQALHSKYEFYDLFCIFEHY
jgi:hypothetical protein